MPDCRGHGHQRSRSSLIAPSFNVSRNLLFCLLMVFFVFPHTSHEFFDFKGEAVARSTADAANKPIAKRPFEKKFKFHKIERLQIDDEEEDDSAGEGEVKDEARKDKREQNYAKNKKKTKTNGDDADDTSKQSVVASAEMTESDELPFERIRSAHKKGRSETDASTTRNRKKRTTDTKKQRAPAAAAAGATPNDDDADINRDENKSEESKLLFSFSALFERAPPDAVEANIEREKKLKSNSIIDWLKWLSKRDDSSEQKVDSAEVYESAESKPNSWLGYLDRWPINSFFPMGKPAKPIRLPRHNRQTQRSALASTSENGVYSDEQAPEMSQENFETLLHTLPSFVASTAHAIGNTECRQQLQIFQRQLRGNKLWTLQMLDATGKVTSGILRGNINQFGDFDQCTQVKTVVKVTPKNPVRIRGKYCLAHIEMHATSKELKVPLHYAQGRGLWRSHFGNPSHFVPRYGLANWGVCIPQLCNGEIVQEMIEAHLRKYNSTGVEFHVEVNDDDCYTRTNIKIMKLIKKDRNFAMTIFGIFGLVTLCLSSIFTKYNAKIISFLIAVITRVRSNSRRNEEEEVVTDSTTDTIDETVAEEDTAPLTVEANNEIEPQEPSNKVLHTLSAMLREFSDAFSLQSTFFQLLDSDHFETQFPIFNILKLVTTFALYICLKYLMIGHLPITNRDQLVRSLSQPQTVLFRLPMLYMDVLLMISGFLVAYQLAEEMEQKSHIQLLKRLTLKVTRFLPTVFVVLFLQTCILPLIGAGPLWPNLIGQNKRLCEQQMWRNFFSVQNAIDFEETCSPMTVQLALEVQLYILGPFLVWLYYTDADAAFFAFGALQAMSVAARYSRTQREYLSLTLFHGMNVSKFYRTANLLFASPITRATPYLLGIGTGLLHRSQAGILEIAAELIPVGWFCALLSILWCFWSTSSGMRIHYVYTAGDAASYAAWCPLVLGLALAWCIFMFPKDENSILRFLITTRPILFLSRITFPLQLMTYLVVLYNTATVNEPRKYQLSDLVNFNEIGVILISGCLLAFLIDVPAQHVRKIVINRLFIERSRHEHDLDAEPSSGTELSEPETELKVEAEVEVDQEEQSQDNSGDIWASGNDTEDVASNIEENEDGEDGENVANEDDDANRVNEISDEQPEKSDNEEETKRVTRRRRRISDD